VTSRSRGLAPVLALAALVAYAPSASAAGGTNGGGNFDCTASDPSVIAKFQTPQEIVAGTGGLSCPAPGARAPGQFGPGSGTSSPPPPPTIGAHCHFDFETPVQFRLNGSTPELLALQPTSSAGVYSADPLAPTWVPAEGGWVNVMFWGGGPGVPPPVATANATLYQMAGTTDFFYHWTFDGTWTQVGPQIKCKPDPASPTGGWNTTCTALSDIQTSCFDPFPPAAPPVSPGLPVGGLNVDLNAFLRGQFTGGQITSLPAQPHPGLANTQTCFFVTGMTVNGRPANPQQDVFWEKIVEGPDVGEGRHVYFVFVIHVSYKGSTWDFGDGSQSPPEAPGGQCGTMPNQQFAVAHTYHSYSTGGGFHVTVTHRFGVDVSEFWRDADPNPHRLDFFDVIPPVDVPSLPQPYVMPIVQEEGVPVG
jgi:hypothetical protein